MNDGRIEKISVIGAGLMGHGIAQVFAAAGYRVSLMDKDPAQLERGYQSIAANLGFLAENGIGKTSDVEGIIARIAKTEDLTEAASGTHFVVEAISENADLKRSLFQDLDGICCPEAILATNTSVISITEIAQAVGLKERVVGTHFWNPPYLIPLVEVIGGRHTSPQTIDITIDLLRSAGKRPVRVKRDVPGFVGNRLQHALWREAISIVEQGIAEAATVDEVVKNGFGLRLPVLGPLENADMIGLDLTLQIHSYILKHLEDSHEPSPLLATKVEKGELGFKTGKGFRDWSLEEKESCQKDLQRHLMEWGTK
jgi:3-hydroxybutyryl-CoA dehydrogenase